MSKMRTVLMCVSLCWNDNSMETHPSSPIDVWQSDYTKQSIRRNWEGNIRTIARSRQDNGRIWQRKWIDDKKYKNTFGVIPVRINTTTGKLLLVFRASSIQSLMHWYIGKFSNYIWTKSWYLPYFFLNVLPKKSTAYKLLLIESRVNRFGGRDLH